MTAPDDDNEDGGEAAAADDVDNVTPLDDCDDAPDELALDVDEGTARLNNGSITGRNSLID